MSIRALSLKINSWHYRDKFIGFAASLLFHIVLLTIGGIVFMKPVQYGVETGLSGVEIHLVAAPAEAIPDIPVVIKEEVREDAVIQKTEEVIPFFEPEIVKSLEIKKSLSTAKHYFEKGDGSTSVLGKDETTIHSSSGALTEAKPNYLKNPAPVYPWEARKKGWEGTVLLKTLIDKNGDPVIVEVEQSSGHSLLDETALKTVRRWKFRPAQLGNIPIESSVHVPIRFELKEG